MVINSWRVWVSIEPHAKLGLVLREDNIAKGVQFFGVPSCEVINMPFSSYSLLNEKRSWNKMNPFIIWIQAIEISLTKLESLAPSKLLSLYL